MYISVLNGIASVYIATVYILATNNYISVLFETLYLKPKIFRENDVD